MKIISWNVNSLRARMPRLNELVATHQPDVICLQETKCSPEVFPREEISKLGYTSCDHSTGRWNGVAILTRDETTATSDPHYGLAGERYPDEGRWIEATCKTTSIELRVVSTYVPNGRTLDHEQFAAKLCFLQAAKTHLAQPAYQQQSVVVGDINIAPTDLDVYDPEVFTGTTHTSPEERTQLEQLQETANLIDSYRHLHPTEVGYTWWDYRQGHFHRNFGLRIDLAFISKELSTKLAFCDIDREFRKGEKPSDHAPLIVELNTAATKTARGHSMIMP